MIIVNKIENNLLSISFKYYQKFVNKCRSIGASFDRQNKFWTIPISQLSKLEQAFKGQIFYQTPRWEITGEAPPDYSKLYTFTTKVDIASLNFKLKPFKYQEFGIKFIIDRLINNGMAFICDDMGLGKTVQALGAIKYMLMNNLSSTIVIIAKKSIKEQWKEEIEKFIDVDVNIYVTSDNKNKRLKMYEEIKIDKKNKIIIANYHILLNDKKYFKPDFVIFDEVHFAKNYKGKINHACAFITKKAKYCLFITGTPITNKPEDLYGIIAIKDKKYFGESYKAFKERYIIEVNKGYYTQTIGYKHLDELRDKIQHLIIRRTAQEVAVELPQVRTINKICIFDIYQENLLREIMDNQKQLKNKISELQALSNPTDLQKEKLSKGNSIMKSYIALEQICANSPSLISCSKSPAIRRKYKKYIPKENYVSDKFIQLLEILDNIKEANRKAIVFTKYATVVVELIEFLKDNKIIANPYYSSLQDDKRIQSINEFKNNPKITAIVGTDALAEGVNLNKADTVINFDLPFNQAIYFQRIGRSRRVGSKHNTTYVYNLLTENTIDKIIYNKILETKQNFDVFVSVDKEQSKLLKRLSN